MSLREVPVLLLLLGIFLERRAFGETFMNSPSVVGDNAKVTVTYDQHVTNVTNDQHVERKTLLIYQGPRMAQVQAALSDILKQHEEIAREFQARQDQQAFDTMRSLLEDKLREIQGTTDGLIVDALKDATSEFYELKKDVAEVKETTQQIKADTGETKRNVEKLVERTEEPKTLLLGGAIGWMGASSTSAGFAEGALVRPQVDIFVSGASSTTVRHDVFVAPELDVTAAEQVIRSPNGVELERTSGELAWRALGAVGYAPFFGVSQSLEAAPVVALGLGGERFSSGVSTDWAVISEVRLGGELHWGGRDGAFRVGVEWAHESALEPVYRFQGFRVAADPERTGQNLFRAYMGACFGVL